MKITINLRIAIPLLIAVIVGVTAFLAATHESDDDRAAREAYEAVNTAFDKATSEERKSACVGRAMLTAAERKQYYWSEFSPEYQNDATIEAVERAFAEQCQ